MKGHNQTTATENEEVAERIEAAKSRLYKKLVAFDVKSSGISEYNQRYMREKTFAAQSTLDLYGRLIYLSTRTMGLPLERFVFVDYGGGTGCLSFLAKEMGIGTVIYNDIYDVSCSDVRILSKSFGLPLDHVVCGDIDELISYLQANSISVNTVTSYDVLEHIYDAKSHLKKLGRLSNDHFRIVYASGANIENPSYVRSVTKKQKEAEYQDREKKWGYKDRDSHKAYFELRKEIISSYSPDLNSEQVEQLAYATRGLIKPDIEKCVAEYTSRGVITYHPEHPTNTCDPLTGNWCEHLMDTRWLQQVLRDEGLLVQILAGYYSVSGSLPKRAIKFFLNMAIRLMRRRGLVIAPYYVVYAHSLAK